MPTVPSSLQPPSRRTSSHRPTLVHSGSVWPQISIVGSTPAPFMPVVQAKLRIGAPNDKYEQEADRVADHVMRMPEAPRPLDSLFEFSGRPAIAQTMQSPSGSGVVPGGFDTSPALGGSHFTPATGNNVQRVPIPNAAPPPGLAESDTPEPIEDKSPGTADDDQAIPATTGGASPAAPASTPAPTIESAKFREHPSELYHGFDPNGQLKHLAIPEGQKRKLAVEVQPSGAQPNYVTTDPSQISITPIADGVEVTSLGGGGGTGRLAGAEIQATDGINVLDQVRFVILPQQQVSVGYHFTSDPPREGLFKNLPTGRTARNPGDEVALTEKLNQVWEPQANIHFTIHSVQSDTFTTRQITSIKGDDSQLDALFRPFASGAQMEVFLVWELSPSGDTIKDPNGRLVKGTNFTILEDGDAPDGFDLAHEAGHFLCYTFHTKSGLMGETTGSPDRPRVLYDWATRANMSAGTR
jgi:hypothetical protein